MTVAVKVVMCQGEMVFLANTAGLRDPLRDVIGARKHDREQQGKIKVQLFEFRKNSTKFWFGVFRASRQNLSLS